MKIRLWISAAALAALSFATVATAQQQQQKPPEPSAEQKAAMEAMIKAGTPGEAHKKLAPTVGVFDCHLTMWMAPGAPPTESTGVSTNEWVLGGRYVQQKFEGSFMGAPFSGIGYTGYDNVKKQYFGTWMDSGSTAAMHSTGTQDDANTWTFTGTFVDPVSGKDTPTKTKFTVADNDHHAFEMWGPDEKGTMFRMMEIKYTRKK